MRMRHILIEGFCDKDKHEIKKNDSYPCKKFNKNMGTHCLECSIFSWTWADRELAYSNKYGVIEKWDNCISVYFDDENETINEKNRNLWEKICKIKIKEAYKEYVKKATINIDK